MTQTVTYPWKPEALDALLAYVRARWPFVTRREIEEQLRSYRLAGGDLIQLCDQHGRRLLTLKLGTAGEPVRGITPDIADVRDAWNDEVIYQGSPVWERPFAHTITTAEVE